MREKKRRKKNISLLEIFLSIGSTTMLYKIKDNRHDMQTWKYFTELLELQWTIKTLQTVVHVKIELIRDRLKNEQLGFIGLELTQRMWKIFQLRKMLLSKAKNSELQFRSQSVPSLWTILDCFQELKEVLECLVELHCLHHGNSISSIRFSSCFAYKAVILYQAWSGSSMCFLTSGLTSKNLSFIY